MKRQLFLIQNLRKARHREVCHEDFFLNEITTYLWSDFGINLEVLLRLLRAILAHKGLQSVELQISKNERIKFSLEPKRLGQHSAANQQIRPLIAPDNGNDERHC